MWGGEGGDEPREHSAIHAGRGLVGLPGKAAGKGGVAARGGRVIRGGAGSRVGSDSRGSSGIGTTPGKRSPSCILSADRCRHVPCTIFRARATPPHLILLIPAVTSQPLICPLVPDRPCPPSSPTPPSRTPPTSQICISPSATGAKTDGGGTLQRARRNAQDREVLSREGMCGGLVFPLPFSTKCVPGNPRSCFHPFV